MLKTTVQPNIYSNSSNTENYVEVTNSGAFSANLFVSYFFNGSYYPINSDLFSEGMSKKIILPVGATDIFVLVRIANGLGQFTPVYNYNFEKSRMLKLEISGDIFSQNCIDITNDPSLPPTTPPKFFVSIKNSGGFIARYSIKYSFNNNVYQVDSQNFTLGMTRIITLPPNVTNIFLLVEVYNGINWVPLYNNNFENPVIWKMELSGTIFSPEYTILPNEPDLGDEPEAKMMVVQYPNVSSVYPGEVAVIISCISNIGNAKALKVSLMATLPENAMFIPGSLTVDNEPTSNTSFPTNGIQIGDIDPGHTKIVTYQVHFKAIPSTDTLEDPIVNYISEGSDDSNITSFTGIATPLTVKVNSDCCNHCCHNHCCSGNGSCCCGHCCPGNGHCCSSNDYCIDNDYCIPHYSYDYN